MENFKSNFTKVIDYSKNLESYNQEKLYSAIVDLRNIHGNMIGGFYKNLDKNLNDSTVRMELSFFDSMIDTTRKVLQLAESKFNLNEPNNFNITQNGGDVSNKQSGGVPKSDKEEQYKKKPMLMLFWADWCGHCHHFMPTFEKLNIVKVSDKEKDLIEEYKIDGFPTLKLYDGKKFHEYSGGRDINNIRDFVNDVLKTDAIKG